MTQKYSERLYFGESLLKIRRGDHKRKRHLFPRPDRHEKTINLC